MRVLGLDTATPATAVALLDEAAEPPLQVSERDDPSPGARPNHTSRLLRLVEEVLGRSGAGWEAIDRIAVGIGPGTFTGLRIGIATAQALARAREIELVGISTLASLAVAARRAHEATPVLAVLDARRGEAFAAAWDAAGDPATDPPALEPCVLAPEGLADVARRLPRGAIAVGDGAVKFAPDLERAGVTLPPQDAPLHRVSALEHCRLAIAAGVRPARPPDAVQPMYLRLPDAEIARRQ